VESETIPGHKRTTARPADGVLSALIAGLSAAILLADLLTPFGYATNPLYVVPIVLTYFVSSQRVALILIAFAALLAGVGGARALMEVNSHDLVSRLIGWGLPWAMGFIMFRIKAREQEITGSTVGLLNVIDHAPVMMWGAGPDGRCTYFNKPWLKFTGRSVDQEVGYGWAEGVHPEDLQRCLAIYAEALKRRQPFSMEYRLRRADGEYRWIWDRGFPQFGANHHYTGYLGACADVTDHKVAESALLQARNDLEREVVVRTAQLEKMVSVLQANVAEREAAEHLLRCREERFDKFMTHLQGFAWIKDDRGRYVFANRYFIQTFGLDPNAVIGKTDTELFPPWVAAQFAANDRKVLELNREVEIIETFSIGTETRYGLANKFPIRYGDKNHVLVGGLAIDITERIRKEQLLTRQAQVIDQIHEAVITIDMEQRVTSWNKGAERLFEYTCDEALGRHLSALFTSDQHHDIQKQMIDCTLDRGNYSGEVMGESKSGRRFYAFLALSVLRHASHVVAGIIVYAKDVTDRKLAEEALRNREADLELALNAAQMGTWNWLVPTNEVHWSEKAIELLGKEQGTSSGTLEAHLACIHEEDRPRIRQSLEEAVARAASYEIEYRCAWPDGTVHWLIEKGKVLLNREQQPVRLTGSVMDITERKEAEARLRDAHQRLRELAKRLVEAEEEERGRLSRELHDEFAQILSGLAFSLARLGKQLQERGEGVLSPDLESDIKSMEGLVGTMIVATRRIATGLRPSVLDQLGLIASLHWLVKDFETRLKIPCEISIPEDLSERTFDSALSVTIFRITQELLTNVARHAEASRVVIDLVTTDGELVLSVHDNGRGITEEALSDGRSLGLRGIRERLAVLGGELEIQGLPEEGTSIQARIPYSFGSSWREEGALR
jgi:PAS domain S-box-containing protein